MEVALRTKGAIATGNLTYSVLASELRGTDAITQLALALHWSWNHATAEIWVETMMPANPVEVRTDSKVGPPAGTDLCRAHWFSKRRTPIAFRSGTYARAVLANSVP